MSDLVSIVIRGKNEEDWLGLCLRSIHEQTYTNYEIIYVDNESSDASVEIARFYAVDKLVSIKDYLPGKAINLGIEEGKGELVVILSAHCIPTSTNWLSQLVSAIRPTQIAGAYGRQLPLSSTSPDDARDLLITFGYEDKVQKKDPFFHNANSIIKRSAWEKVRFDDAITNIEDRDWAKKILGLGLQIKYDSSASVFHYHGLHQHNNYESFRAAAVNNLIKKIDDDDKDSPTWLEMENRICPVVFYGKAGDVAQEIKRFKKNTRVPSNIELFYYGTDDPKVPRVTFLKRNVTSRAPFYKFTKDILELSNAAIGYHIEALCFVDITYKKFIKNSYAINKSKVFSENLHFSSFALMDKGNVWVRSGEKVSPLKDTYDSKTQFLRVAFGQGSVLRASAIRMQKSNPTDGFVHTVDDINYLVRG